KGGVTREPCPRLTHHAAACPFVTSASSSSQANLGMPPLPLACRAIIGSALTGSPVTVLQARHLLISDRWLQDGSPPPAEPPLVPAAPLGPRPEPHGAGAEAVLWRSLIAASSSPATVLMLVACAFACGLAGSRRRAATLAAPAGATKLAEEVRGAAPGGDPRAEGRPDAGAGSADLPEVCPQFMRASGGVRLSVPMPPPDLAAWSCPIDLCALSPSLRVDRSTGPATPLLAASLRWAELGGQLRRVLEVVERGPGGAELVSVDASLEVRLAGGAPFGRLRSVGGRRYVLEQAGSGRGVLCVSTDLGASSLEVGQLPEGLLLATAERSGAAPAPAAASGSAAAASEVAHPAGAGAERAGAGGCGSLEVLAKPGVDAVFVLACALAVLVFAAPRRFHPAVSPAACP
ncbi:unnamed protein product, partial [Prorocentrum cordatum]